RDYLEKLINLEIAVPDTPSDEPHRLLEEDSAETHLHLGTTFKWLRWVVIAACLVGAIAGAWFLGGNFQLPATTSQLHETATQATVSPPTKIEASSAQSYFAETSLDIGSSTNPFPQTEAMDIRNDIPVSIIAI